MVCTRTQYLRVRQQLSLDLQRRQLVTRTLKEGKVGSLGSRSKVHDSTKEKQVQ